MTACTCACWDCLKSRREREQRREAFRETLLVVFCLYVMACTLWASVSLIIFVAEGL